MQQNTINNRSIFGNDNLEIIQGIDSNSIDLIYLDPPFNKKKIFTAPIGSSAEGASFSDIFRKEDIKDEWIQTIKEDQDKLYGFLSGIKNIEGKTSYNYCYLCYMAIRLIEFHRTLKSTGSIYLHCDPTMSHYLKLLLDCIFGEKNFISEIVWNYGTPSGGRVTGKKPVKSHDNILCYAYNYGNHIYNIQYLSYDEKYINEWFRHKDENGRFYQTRKRGNKIVRQYLDESNGVPLSNTWSDLKQLYGKTGWFPTTQTEKTGYPTQKPLALLERIIKASSKEGDVILDPFCGCATTCIAAEKLNRQWIGIDISVKAYDLVRKRLKKEVANPEDLFQHDNIVTYSQSTPQRTDQKQGDNIHQKWIYVISNEQYPGEYKVGIAKDWKSRLNSYQTSDPNRNYKLEYKVLTPHFRELEKHIHDTFDNRHEWVQADLKKLIQAIDNY